MALATAIIVLLGVLAPVLVKVVMANLNAKYDPGEQLAKAKETDAKHVASGDAGAVNDRLAYLLARVRKDAGDSSGQSGGAAPGG